MLHRAHLAPTAVTTLLAFVCLAGTTTAATYVPMADEALADQAPVIVQGEILRRVDPAASGPVRTSYVVRVLRPVKGQRVGDITVQVPGGTRPDGSGLHIPGTPRFAPGERALLFLAARADGTYGIHQLMLGAFHVREGGGRPVAVRDLREATAVGPPGRPERPRDLARFVAWLEDRARGRHRTPDYEAAAAGETFIGDAYDLMGHRWTQFDTAGNVPWRAHQSGQSGMAGGGFSRFQNALAVWTNDPATPVDIPYAGTTTANGGFRSPDGVNGILFDDPFGEVDGTFSCFSGGVLAIGGAWTSGTVSWKGTSFRRAVEGDIITNNGAGCFYGDASGADGEEVFGHELGHTLGLGHSSLSNALMYAFAHGDGRGAALTADDRNGLAYLYQAVTQSATVAFAASGSTPGEGIGTTGVTVVLSTTTGPLTSTVTVNWATADGTATAGGGDYGAASGTLTFPVGTPSGATQTLLVAVGSDATDEPNETFSVVLGSPVNATLGSPATHVLTIVDDDPLPNITIDDGTVGEGQAGATNAVLQVRLDRPSSQTVTVNWQTAPGTATTPSDYTHASGVATFAPGQTAVAVAVPVQGDALDEEDETVLVLLSSPSSTATLADAQGVVTIADDDPPPTVSISDVVVTESNGPGVTAVFLASLSSQSGRPVVVTWATADFTATAPGDYMAATGTATIPPGAFTVTITVNVAGDVLDEPAEVFFVYLTGASNGIIGDPQGGATITDDDPTPVLTVSDCATPEGDSGTSSCVLALTLSGPSASTVSVAYSTVAATAAAGADYPSASGTVSFPPGVTSMPLALAVTGDLLDEDDETFLVNLSNPSGLVIGDAQAQVTITDDDTSTVSVADASALEGSAGTNTLWFTIALSNPSEETVSVPYSTSDGSATAGSDYTATAATAVFAPGEMARLVGVPITGDGDVEPDETLTLSLGTPTSAVLGDGTATGTIVNDDPLTEAGRAEFALPGRIARLTVSDTEPTRWLKVRLVPGRSYAARAWAPATDPSESPVALALEWFLDNGLTPASDASIADAEPSTTADGHGGASATILPTVAECPVSTGCTYRLRLQATGAAGAFEAKVLVVETTLTAAYWAVATAAGYDAAPQVRNNTVADVSVTFTAFGSGGGVVCASTFVVPANGVTTFGLSGGAPGCSIASGFGSAQIALHGPPGSITANITTFSTLSGLSFDAPFRPRNTWTSLKTP